MEVIRDIPALQSCVYYQPLLSAAQQYFILPSGLWPRYVALSCDQLMLGCHLLIKMDPHFLTCNDIAVVSKLAQQGVCEKQDGEVK